MLRIDAGESVQIIDARPRHYTTKSSEIMAGAVWRDPERLGDWIGKLSKEKPVVTYCVYGFHIGCQTAIAPGPPIAAWASQAPQPNCNATSRCTAITYRWVSPGLTSE